MSFQLNLPPSVVAQATRAESREELEEEGPKKQTREDWRKLKELEEARKAGTAPAMQDEEGRDINPHIPQYVMQAPWYFGAVAPTLQHQRMQSEKEKQYSKPGSWYKKGVQEGPIATKYRKGACENCGALTHKKKDCLERPRKVGARFTGSDIAPDEHVQPNLAFDYDGKRDRWNGYNMEDHTQIAEEFQKVDEAKKYLKAQRLDKAVTEGKISDLELHQSGGEDEDKYAEDVDMPGQKFETKQRITVRNLRIREDTAKYLYNLDVSSAFYDPKTRSMRENPFQANAKDANELPYAGDNFVRHSGAADQFAKKQLFAWEAYEKGAEVHLQADPTKLDLLAREYQQRKEEHKTSQKDSILEKYGGEEHLNAPSKQLLMAQTEEYVEYSRQGNVIKGQEKAPVKSKYEEDVYNNNHTSVWGSFWNAGRWGYKCCHSFIKGSYCTGEAGKDTPIGELLALPEGEEQQEEEEEEEEEIPEKTLAELHQEKRAEEERKKKEERRKKKNKKKKKKKHKKKKESSSDESESSEDEEAKKEKRIQLAMIKLSQEDNEADRLLKMDERKRPYNSMFVAKEPTEEEMEAFKRKRVRSDDPMAQFLNQ